jgi:hypothetical protein
MAAMVRMTEEDLDALRAAAATLEHPQIFRYAAGCVRRTRSIAFWPPCRKSRNSAEMNSELNRARSREGA